MVNVASDVWTVADRRPDHPAVISRDVSLTFSELRTASRKVAGTVRAAGFAPLDRVVFIAPTIYEFPIVYYGLHTVGVTVITLNTMSTAPEIGYVLDDSGASLVIAWHECSEAAKQAAVGRGIDVWEVTAGARLDGGGCVAGPPGATHDHEPLDTATILYTSGTTGRPKGAELTAENLVATPLALYPLLNITPEDRFGTALPLFHVFGQAVLMNAVLMKGVTLSLLSPFNPVAMLDMIRDHQLTGVMGVPTMWNAMLHAAGGYHPEDFRNLRLAVSGGAPLPVEVLHSFNERFGCVILEGYGLSETTGVATFNDFNKVAKPGTVGRGIVGAVIELRGPGGTAVSAGEIGEVFVKGPMVMKGYWNRPEATASDLKDGWLKTGDLGTFDDDGYLSIVDRTKDLIIRGGYNVYPREVEEILYEHPDIVEVAVIGVPDAHYGEEIAAVISLRPGTVPNVEQIRGWAREQLSAYKVPRLFRFVESLPKGPTGKILKRAIDRDAIRASAPTDPIV